MTEYPPIQPKPVTINTFMFQDDGLLPNNPKLPVILYPGVLKDKSQYAERLFNQNGWLNSWQNGIFSYHHYHSNAHEVLGVISGSGSIQLGGNNGITLEVSAGDVLVLSAGTAHKHLSSSSDFLVAGAYPEGVSYNTRQATTITRAEALLEIASVPIPENDPVYGLSGPLKEVWTQP